MRRTVTTGIFALVTVIVAAILIIQIGNRWRGTVAATGHGDLMPRLVWDFRKGADMSAVGWPANVGGSPWRVDSPAMITLIAPDGQRGEFEAHSFQVYRENGHVTGVLISMQNEDSSSAYVRAKSLAEEWGILRPAGSSDAREALRRLDQWYSGFKPGGTGKGVRMCELIRNDLWPSRTVSIRSSYDEKAPWFVGLAFGRLHVTSATKPSTHVSAGRMPDTAPN